MIVSPDCLDWCAPDFASCMRQTSFASHSKPFALFTQVLKSTAIRNYANNLAYKDPALATDDAMRIGRLHTYLSGMLYFAAL